MHRTRTTLGWCAGALGLLSALAGCQGSSESPSADGPLGTSEDALTNPNAASRAPAIRRWTLADELIIAPIWVGDEDKGTLYTPLFRGALPGIEELVYAPRSGDCRRPKATVRVDWDKAADTVRFIIKGHDMDAGPSVQRTDGVDYWDNPFHPNPKDFTNGAYRLWILQASTTRLEKLWYSGADLSLAATEFTAPSQPPGTIELQLPSFLITGTKQMGHESGDFVHEFTNSYAHFTNEGGLFSGDWVTFGPLDLCQAAPFQPAISQFRPIASPWQPPETAQSWRNYLRAGLAFDLHAEEKADPNVLDGNLPYVYSGVSVLSNHPGMQGGVPNGWHMVLMGAILNVQPPLEPVQKGNDLGYTAYVNEPRVSAPRYCELLPPPGP